MSEVECAGSVDTSSTRLPSRLAASAVADAQVVLPTPPLPPKNSTSRSSSARITATGQVAERRAIHAHPPMPEMKLVEQVGIDVEQVQRRRIGQARRFPCSRAAGTDRSAERPAAAARARSGRRPCRESERRRNVFCHSARGDRIRRQAIEIACIRAPALPGLPPDLPVHPPTCSASTTASPETRCAPARRRRRRSRGRSRSRRASSKPDRFCCQTTNSDEPGLYSQRSTLVVRNERMLKSALPA